MAAFSTQIFSGVQAGRYGVLGCTLGSIIWWSQHSTISQPVRQVRWPYHFDFSQQGATCVTCRGVGLPLEIHSLATMPPVLLQISASILTDWNSFYKVCFLLHYFKNLGPYSNLMSRVDVLM